MKMDLDEGVTLYRDENNNIKEALDLVTFDREPGYYQQVIRPMLTPGHETELIFWLRNLGILKNNQICNNAGMECNKLMSWKPSRTQDMFQWTCNNCNIKKSIREDSLLYDVKCSFKNVLRILLGWCKGTDYETMAIMLGIKNHNVRGLYNKAAKMAEKYIKANIQEFQIGGPGVIVVIDTYPIGCSNQNTLNRGCTPILCLSEIKSMPQKFWFRALEKNRNNLQIKINKDTILTNIKQIVKPGSILVIPSESQLCSYAEIRYLKYLYPTIVTINGLCRHNTAQTTCEGNLEVIWSGALDVCEQAQLFSHNQMQQYLTSQIWQRRFGADAFEILLYQFGVHQ